MGEKMGVSLVSVTFRYENRGTTPIIVQVEPWAGVYRLFTNDEFVLIAESATQTPEFELIEDGDTRYLTIHHSEEYFVVRGGVRLHWTDCPNFGFEAEGSGVIPPRGTT
jgi:hypothetical protein